MNLLSAQQIKEWDLYTMRNEPIASIDLMERAALACVDWIKKNLTTRQFYVFCGTGNNGGDGLAVARLLSQNGVNVKVFILESAKRSPDFVQNLERLKTFPDVPAWVLTTESDFPDLADDVLLIDALFGTGLNRPLEGLSLQLVNYINRAEKKVVSIDIPSGLLCDRSSKGQTTIKATHTLTFQQLKKAFLVAENEASIGCPHVLDIGLAPAFPAMADSRFKLTNNQLISAFYKSRGLFSHKGSFGHALLFAGSYGKTGAATLCTKACLRSGAGLVSVHLPQNSVNIVQTSTPEAMCRVDAHSERITALDYDLTLYDSVGIGPGIGTKQDTAELVYKVIMTYNRPLVIDADALNILSENTGWLSHIPPYSILTPHPKEFVRLFGDSTDDFEKINLALAKAEDLSVIIVLKGHHSFIAVPEGKGYFNTTGNPGMATGGSGDVLTGILTGLLAQGYSPEQSAVLGVYLHGLAGDIAAEKYGMNAMIAGDLIEALKFLDLRV